METNKPNPFEIAQRQLDEAAAILKLDPAVHELLLSLIHISEPTRPY